MALLGNHSVLLKLPLRFFGGSPTSVEPQLQSNFNKSGAVRNRMYQDQTTTANKLYSLPDGSYPGVSWFIPQKGGAMTAHNTARITFTPVASGLMGLPAEGTAFYAITVADADGQLISSGEGTASFTITTNEPLLTASINGQGVAEFLISAADALLGAIADGYGSSSYQVTSTAVILPTNDASPLRNGAASFSITGELVPYALGIMGGTTTDSGVLTNDSIASAVWDTVLAEHQTDGSAGKGLATASSGGVDYAALANAVWTNVSRTLTSGDAPTPEEITASIMSALQAATIPVDIAKVNGEVLKGTGTEANPWGPV